MRIRDNYQPTIIADIWQLYNSLSSSLSSFTPVSLFSSSVISPKYSAMSSCSTELSSSFSSPISTSRPTWRREARLGRSRPRRPISTPTPPWNRTRNYLPSPQGQSIRLSWLEMKQTLKILQYFIKSFYLVNWILYFQMDNIYTKVFETSMFILEPEKR